MNAKERLEDVKAELLDRNLLLQHVADILGMLPGQRLSGLEEVARNMLKTFRLATDENSRLNAEEHRLRGIILKISEIVGGGDEPDSVWLEGTLEGVMRLNIEKMDLQAENAELRARLTGFRQAFVLSGIANWRSDDDGWDPETHGFLTPGGYFNDDDCDEDETTVFEGKTVKAVLRNGALALSEWVHYVATHEDFDKDCSSCGEADNQPEEKS